MAQINDITKQLDNISKQFDKSLEKAEKAIFDECIEAIKDLETKGGKIVPSLANLKQILRIQKKLEKAMRNKAYLDGVNELVNSFGSVYKTQFAYYSELSKRKINVKRYEEVQKIARENTLQNLTGAGVATQVTSQLREILLRSVTSNEKYSDLVAEFRNQMLTTDKTTGALSKYAKTYATTALTQYAGENNKLFTEDLGLEWYMYVGSNIETTRDFCLHCTAKKYIHRSEFHNLLKGHIEYNGKVHDVKIYDKTGLPQGMIEGTNEQNFQVNVGGWGCRHQLVPVAKQVVPKELQEKFKKK